MIIAVTGGIGSGKSYVSKLLARELECSCINADDVVHQLTAPGGLAMPFIEAAFGKDFLTQDGTLDRKKMRELIFNHPNAKRKLESITNPIIERELFAILKKEEKSNPYVVVEIPLLFESNYWEFHCNVIISVVCDESTQIKRVKARNNFSDDMVLKIIETQVKNDLRIEKSDLVIRNEDGDALNFLSDMNNAVMHLKNMM